jgi:dephospho-CoA kinase
MGGEGTSSAARVLVGGGIGAGKSSVCDLFARRGFLVVSADEVGHRILTDASVVSEVATRWPEVVDGGVIDRAALAAIVFADTDALAVLEGITHPRIVAAIRSEIASHALRDIVVEAPIPGLFDGDPFVRVAVVADDEVRIARAVTRGSSKADVERRMANQVDDDVWSSWADIVVDNTGAWHDTELEIDAVIEGIRSDA